MCTVAPCFRCPSMLRRHLGNSSCQSVASLRTQNVSPTSSAGLRRTSENHRRPYETCLRGTPAIHGDPPRVSAHMQEEDLTRSPITRTCLLQLTRRTVCAVYIYLSYTYICTLHTRRGLNRMCSSGSPIFTLSTISANPTPV
jgi:hypothetical protein